MALFRVDFSGRGELSERQQKVMDSKTFPDTPYLLVPSQLAQVQFSVVGALQLPKDLRRCSPNYLNFPKNSMQVVSCIPMAGG
jgi:hypothetical protein